MQQQPLWLRDKWMVPLFLGLYGIGFLLCSWLSTGTYGGGDSWMHYLFAKYAFKHPMNLMDQWAKPLFTLLASPWAQFGFLGIKLFNILCAIATGYICYLIAKEHVDRYAWVSTLFVLSVPIYFVSVYSGLTEILFALFLVSGIYLYQNFRDRWACVLISFLPFVRSEGFLIIPVFAAITLHYKQYLTTLLLATGTLVFTIIGYSVTHQIGWVFSTNPYLLATNVYGKGPLLQFVKNNENIAGVPQVLLVLSAIVIFLVSYYKQWRAGNFASNRLENIRLILVFGSFAVYFVAHSIFWKLGIFGSLGLNRVMAGIAPCIGLTAFFAFDNLMHTPFVNKYFKIMQYIAALLVAAVFLMPLKVNRHDIPYRLSALETAQFKACEWIRSENFNDYFFYYYDPFVSHLLNLDPFDTNKTASITYRDNYINFKENSIVIWDSQFCPQEGHLPKRWLDANPDFQLLHEEHNNESVNAKGDTLQIRIYKTLKNIELKNMN